jgi:hypothetical protein
VICKRHPLIALILRTVSGPTLAPGADLARGPQFSNQPVKPEAFLYDLVANVDLMK